ncbi:MAG TPA: hypothetical protein VFM46_11360, partial [Pseudomonadales bacterium]|nr:hypothetical protein [Pseudomonadales bacterium]
MKNNVSDDPAHNNAISPFFFTMRSAAVVLLSVTATQVYAANPQSGAPMYLQLKPASNYLTFRNDSGISATYSSAGPINIKNEFFQILGSNGRSCVDCHQPREGWTITPVGARKLFASSKGKNPLFRTNDGASSPKADVSTLQARRSAYNMLLTKGLIRVGLPVPENAEFELVAV